MTKNEQNWIRMQFKKNKVWLSVDNNGHPVEKNNKVLIKYQLEQDYEYWVHKNNVIPIGSSQISKTDKKPRPKLHGKAIKKKDHKDQMDTTLEKNAVCIYTDGASSGNPGPSGIGVVLRYDGHEKKISEYIGEATNNIAELKAIKAGILELKKKYLPVRIFTDSAYAYGVLVLGWKAKKNTRLINSIKKEIALYKDLKLIKVKGHAGHEGNELADKLATSAISKRK